MRTFLAFIRPRQFHQLALASLLAAGSALAQGVPAQPQATSLNALATAVQNIGLARCGPALERLSEAGVQGARNNDVLLDWDRKRAATSPVFSMIGLEYPGSGAAMTVTTVPEADGSCSVSAERITVAPISCATVARQELTGTQRTQLLPNFAVHTDPKDHTTSVSLIDTPPGCLVIRRYVEFNWKDPGPTGLGAAPAAARK
jgi:hypothetical protein